MSDLITFVTNSRPTYVASPCTDENGRVVEVVLSPVVAWRIEYDPAINSGDSLAIPITIEGQYQHDHAIYFSDTKQWVIPHTCSGDGMDSLLEHFQEEEALERQILKS